MKLKNILLLLLTLALISCNTGNISEETVSPPTDITEEETIKITDKDITELFHRYNDVYIPLHIYSGVGYDRIVTIYEEGVMKAKYYQYGNDYFSVNTWDDLMDLVGSIFCDDLLESYDPVKFINVGGDIYSLGSDTGFLPEMLGYEIVEQDGDKVVLDVSYDIPHETYEAHYTFVLRLTENGWRISEKNDKRWCEYNNLD